MKVTVVVNGKFHAFDYAAELFKLGFLHRLVSTMPYFVARRYGIPRSVYVGMPWFEVLKRSFRRLLHREPPPSWYARLFTRAALRHVPVDSDVIVSFAGYSLEIFESPRFRQAFKVLDRGATHTIANTQLRLQASAYHGVSWTPHTRAFIGREMKEYDLADRILVPSGFVRSTFTDNGVNPDKIWRIPYGMSLQKFKGMQPSAAPAHPYVLFVGQVSTRKGVGVLIEAMEIVRASRPDLELWLVGSPYPGFPESLLDQPWIRKFGVLRGQALYDAFAGASVFSLLSFEEGLALVLTEALQFGLPMVLTRNTGGEDLVREPEDGYFVPVGDAAAAAGRILECLERKRRPFATPLATPLAADAPAAPGAPGVLPDAPRHTWADFTQRLLAHLEPKREAV